jgi:4-diphosphocytidyl-2-C-methyl-D-erythritol kinase
VRAPAKVNLHLGVGSRREDGYHDVVTVLQAVSLYDEVTISAGEPVRAGGTAPPGGPVLVGGPVPAGGPAPAEEPIAVTVGVTGEGAARTTPPSSLFTSASEQESARIALVPTGPDNLAVRAAYLVAEAAGLSAASIHMTLSKGIPVAAGMAGGSADAAAALLACENYWQAGLDRTTLVELAARLGSDVPFPLTGGTALGTGRGEQLTPVLGRGEYHWVFALADGGLSTASVYAEFDRLSEGKLRTGPTPAEGVLAALRTGDPIQLGAALVNDLQPAALRLRPALRRVLESGQELGAVGALVSGSGPTCAFLCRDSADSVALAASLAGMGVCRAVRRAHGPVAGARVIEPSTSPS